MSNARAPRRRYATPIESKLAAQKAYGVTAEQLAAKAQVTALSQLKSTSPPVLKLRKAPDLLEHAGGKPHNRAILEDPAARLEKLCIETGWDVRRNKALKMPLEPWTGPSGSMLMYADLMRDPDGAHNLAQYGAPGHAALEWMREEELISIGEAGEIHGLSDGRPKAGRRYPGAPVSDALAKAGRQLRDRARGLVLAALFNLSTGRTVRRTRKRQRHAAETADGMRLTAAAICAEANRIKARRPELDGCKYLSLSRCRDLIRDLIEAGLITQLEPPRAVRQKRSWRTVPRMIARITDQAASALGLRPPHTEVS
jgi:hypothetical protein